MIDELKLLHNYQEQSQAILPQLSTKHELIEAITYEETKNKIIAETTSIISFLSNLTETIQKNATHSQISLQNVFLSLRYIKQNNFFFPNQLLKKVVTCIKDFIKIVGQSINDLTLKQIIFEKIFITYENIIQYKGKEIYLSLFYQPNKEKEIYEAFYYDIAKITKKDEIDIMDIKQLQLIFDIVKCKMEIRRKNDIDKTLYDMGIFGRVFYRKASFQLNMKKKKKKKMIINSNVKSTFNDDDIIQLFAEEKPIAKGKGSHSSRHFLKNKYKNIQEQYIMVWNSHSLNKQINKEKIKEENKIKDQANTEHKDKDIDNNMIINSDHKQRINIQAKQDTYITETNSNYNNINDSKAYKEQTSVQMPINTTNIIIEENNLITTDFHIIENEINASKTNQELMLNYSHTHNEELPTNQIHSQNFPQSNDFINTNPRVQSQENVLTNINIHNIQMNQSTDPAKGLLKNNDVYNLGQNQVMNNPKQNQNKSNSKQQDQKNIINNYPQNQNQNYNQINMNMQITKFYQSMMSKNSQQYNRNFFHSSNSNAQYNHMNNQANLTSDQLKADYLTLKTLEHDNSTLIKSNLLKYEQYIILPIYQQLNRSINQKKNNYADVFNRYKPIILSVLVKNQLEKSIVQPFGSIVNNFLLDEGDVDICIVPDNCTIEDFSVHLNEINETIQAKHLGACVLSHISPRYSLLKINDTEGGMIVDITVQSMLPLHNTRLIRAYSLYDQRFHILGIYIKYWVKRNKINGATDHFLSSYALIIMIIHFLQMEIKPSVLPVLQKVTNENKIYEYSHSEKVFKCNVYFEEDISKIKNYMNIINDNHDNKDSVSFLLLKFFEFYGYNYDHSYLISISNSDKIPASSDHIAFPIDDPFDEEHNPGKSMKLNTPQYDTFINCMKKEINHILRGDFMGNDFVLGYY